MESTKSKTQTIELSVKERISLVRFIEISSTGFADRITLNSVKNELDFSEKEVRDLKMRDVNAGNGQLTTTWDPKKANNYSKKIYLSKDRDKALRKIIVSLNKQSRNLVDGFSENIFNVLQWGKDELKTLSEIVDEMDKNEQITQQNFAVCKAIKDAKENESDNK